MAVLKNKENDVRACVCHFFFVPLQPILIRNSMQIKVKGYRLAVIGLLLLSSFSSIKAEDVVYITTEQFKNRIFDYTTERDWKYKGDKPCIIDFYTTWCGPCKRLAPIMEELSQTYCDQVLFYKADTEREQELAYVFQISSIPQVLYIPMEGKPMLLKGLYPKEEIIKIIDEFLLAPSQAPKAEVPETPQEEVQPQAEPKKSLWQRWKEKIQQRSHKK